MILGKSFNLSEAQCYNLEFMKAPNIEHGNYHVSVFLMKSQIKGLLFGGILIFVFFPASCFSGSSVPFHPWVHPRVHISGPVGRDLRNTATTGDGNLISYSSEEDQMDTS